MPTRAVLLDALGTLVALDPPAAHLARALAIPHDDRVAAAVDAEMSFYRGHAHEGRDDASLADLRRRCASVLSDALGREIDVATMMSAIRFRPYPDAESALRDLRARGIRLVCVSNWDVSLPQVLGECGLANALDGVVTSAAAGSRKPDPAIFATALAVAGCDPEDALHVGDTPEEDGEGAAAAGIPHLLIDRDGAREIASLAEIVFHLRP